MKKIDPSKYIYELPEEKIAKFPLARREDSKLLVYKNKKIIHDHFHAIENYLPENSTLFFNDTKVIPARLIFQRTTGAFIEIFLLEPVYPDKIMQQAMKSTSPVVWQCMIGNLKKWKPNETLEAQIRFEQQDILLKAELMDRNNLWVQLSWQPLGLSFSEIISAAGKIPLPPYLKREVDTEDKDRYQTVYSHVEGAVAAPTAGLHFTPEILQQLKERGNRISNLTLHVSAGTFQPIKTNSVQEHPMHSEQILVKRENLEEILNAKSVISVGTTSMRTLESLYWYGTALCSDPGLDFNVSKLQPYERHQKPIVLQTAIEAILKKMQEDRSDTLVGNTEIFIFPGYDFKVCDGLITNYHLPGSTLILLIAAFVGENWKNIYQQALENNYRFLSYGDSSFLIP